MYYPQAGFARGHELYASGSESTPWPRPVPARIGEGSNPKLMVLTLGEVETPLADGLFDPLADSMTLDDGRVIDNYYRNELGIRFFAPFDKSRFPLPPSGWCSWYYYYKDISPEEIETNARWLSENLREYGARVCQLDDGWQGAGDDEGTKRDWTTTDPCCRWDLAQLASRIRELELEPGIWLAPHGQSSDVVAKRRGCFLKIPDGSSASSTWVGRWLLDPTHPGASEYLRDLFARLRGEWGYSYFKVDGQPTVLEEYRKKGDFMATPGGDAETLLRGTLETIREAIGPGSYLLGCWGTPLAGIGILNGSRSSDDVEPSWKGFRTAFEAMVRWGFLHNIAWYNDPDVLIVRPPLGEGKARAWATAVGLSGQALMASDRMPDLPASRVSILKKVFPAVDVRPLDLFKPQDCNKTIWDLKVNHNGRRYDVVACFNLDERKPDRLRLNWEELGLKADAPYHLFDFWRGAYLGCREKGYSVEVPPADCRVITLVKAEQRPQLISTDRHITQGWIDLLELDYDAQSMTYSGKSALIGGEPLTLTFAFPPSGTTFTIKSVTADGAKAAFENNRGWAQVRLHAAETGQYRWRVRFEPTIV